MPELRRLVPAYIFLPVLVAEQCSMPTTVVAANVKSL